MRVSMIIESDGVTTEVSRDYEPDVVDRRSYQGSATLLQEIPGLGSITQAVSEAAVIAHRIAEI